MKALTGDLLTPSMEQTIVAGARTMMEILGKYYRGEITQAEMDNQAVLTMAETCDAVVYEYDTAP